MIRIGIIGAGNNAAGHARYYHQSPRTEVVAIADPDRDRAAKLAEEVDARPLDDFRDFVDDVDAVVISSPNFLHRDHAVGCAQAGRHVFCEKPMGLDAAEARQIADAVDAAGVHCTVGFSVRFGPPVQTFQRLLREDAIGQPVSLWSRRLHYLDPAAHAGWRMDPARSGGLLLEINVHELDWLMALGGDVDSVFARTAAHDASHPRANDHVWFTLNLACGAVAQHEGSWLAATPNMFIGLHGRNGGAQTDPWRTEVQFSELGGSFNPVELAPPFDLRAHFLDTIEHGTDPVADAAWGLKVMTVAEAIFESAATGRVVPVAEVAVT